MSDTKDQAEPTMEEILASIRRIISEDEPEPEGEPEPAVGSRRPSRSTATSLSKPWALPCKTTAI